MAKSVSSLVVALCSAVPAMQPGAHATRLSAERGGAGRFRGAQKPVEKSAAKPSHSDGNVSAGGGASSGTDCFVNGAKAMAEFSKKAGVAPSTTTHGSGSGDDGASDSSEGEAALLAEQQPGRGAPQLDDGNSSSNHERKAGRQRKGRGAGRAGHGAESDFSDAGAAVELRLPQARRGGQPASSRDAQQNDDGEDEAGEERPARRRATPRAASNAGAKGSIVDVKSAEHQPFAMMAVWTSVLKKAEAAMAKWGPAGARLGLAPSGLRDPQPLRAHRRCGAAAPRPSDGPSGGLSSENHETKDSMEWDSLGDHFEEIKAEVVAAFKKDHGTTGTDAFVSRPLEMARTAVGQWYLKEYIDYEKEQRDSKRSERNDPALDYDVGTKEALAHAHYAMGTAMNYKAVADHVLTGDSAVPVEHTQSYQDMQAEQLKHYLEAVKLFPDHKIASSWAGRLLLEPRLVEAKGAKTAAAAAAEQLLRAAHVHVGHTAVADILSADAKKTGAAGGGADDSRAAAQLARDEQLVESLFVPPISWQCSNRACQLHGTAAGDGFKHEASKSRASLPVGFYYQAPGAARERAHVHPQLSVIGRADPTDEEERGLAAVFCSAACSRLGEATGADGALHGPLEVPCQRFPPAELVPALAGAFRDEHARLLREDARHKKAAALVKRAMAQDGVSNLVAGKPDGEKFVVDFMHAGVEKKMELMGDSRAMTYWGIFEQVAAVFMDDLLEDEDIQMEIEASGEREAVMDVVAQLKLSVGAGLIPAMELQSNLNLKGFFELLGRKLG